MLLCASTTLGAMGRLLIAYGVGASTTHTFWQWGLPQVYGCLFCLYHGRTQLASFGQVLADWGCDPEPVWGRPSVSKVELLTWERVTWPRFAGVL